ncbi:MAG: tRNA pseudouridine(38-40) synthase TruA [Spirochaetales bacterium]|nr:tRNA pseudouridine(38-40) synthase TruA [Spirochaetales bacterium]
MTRRRKLTRNLKVILCYDGTDFCGWQIQRQERTVQGVVEEALFRLHEHPVRVKAAGRTDSGVHARGQVISFESDSTVPDERFARALNSRLPRDVRAVAVHPVDDEFHARYTARRRIYKYYLLPAAYSDPFARRYCLTVKRDLDMQRLNGYAGRILGVHDFTTFAAASDDSGSMMRQIFSSAFCLEGRFIVYRIEGNSFLWKMVRSLVGTMLAADSQGLSPLQFGELLDRRDRTLAGDTAPAKGLFLTRVIYDE